MLGAASDSAVARPTRAGYLGTNILHSGFDLDVIVHSGAGAYICGEESALPRLTRGVSRPTQTTAAYPAIAGLYGYPTVINNVGNKLACVPYIVLRGADWWKQVGPSSAPVRRSIRCPVGSAARAV